ncbi:MAG TPA: 6,7-dimethyl-8-ribityllumazine synthase [Gammaproteobacteria bacterium]|mgnify:FL=1|nr:6,7-dimethyl-8-ribityllumazine synthase [Gammaproteobacteria bacterium]|tara:strand:+ start:1814 stop:2296 length:483 start_codon:yes stop_codon:yes gene_type:complete
MQSVIDVSALPKVENPGRICILKAKWYPDLVENMATACEEILVAAGYQDIEQHVLPGSLEIPLAARDLLARDTAKQIDAIVCLGIILKGDTIHFEMISYECMHGLAAVMHEFQRPVIVEILPVFEMQHAIDRASKDDKNKGIEAAAAAIEMVTWRRSLGY